MKDVVDGMIERWHEDGEPTDALAVGIFTRMSLILREISAHKSATLDRLGQPMWAIATVYALRRRGRPYRSSPTELAAELGVTQAAMTARVRRLVEQKLVTTGPHPDDARRVVVGLTAKGHRLTGHVRRVQGDAEAHRLAALDPSQRAMLDALLRRVLAAPDE